MFLTLVRADDELPCSCDGNAGRIAPMIFDWQRAWNGHAADLAPLSVLG
jgi:hypothetical protein